MEKFSGTDLHWQRDKHDTCVNPIPQRGHSVLSFITEVHSQQSGITANSQAGGSGTAADWAGKEEKDHSNNSHWHDLSRSEYGTIGKKQLKMVDGNKMRHALL